MNEPLSNAATVLIARMKSHPKDFEYGNRFGYLQDSLMQLIGVGVTNQYGGMGRLAYLSDADRAALADAWREVNYVKFEKEIMEATFKSDAEFEEEKKQFVYPMGQSALRPGMLAVSTGTSAPQPVTAMNAAMNSTGNTGLFGSGGAGLLGLFK